MRSLLLPALMCLVSLSYAQEKAQISGRILDANNIPIPYASVYIEDLKLGTVSNDEGFYFLNNVPYGQRTIKARSEEHTSELQSRENLVCRLLLDKKKR